MVWQAWMFGLTLLTLTGCVGAYGGDDAAKEAKSEISVEMTEKTETEAGKHIPETERMEEGGELGERDSSYVTEGTENYRDFVVDSVLHSHELGDIHYCVFIPDGYDGGKAYSLYITLPGYQGLYFQGSARKTIALTEYFLEHYNVQREQVYISGYSGGGETLSLVLDRRPELYTAALMCSSRWDGGYQTIAGAKTPVYFVTGESDEYYGSEPFDRAYREIRSLYEAEGLSETEIDRFVVLDIKPADYFTDKGMKNQHGGGAGLFSRDSDIMGWLFGEHES